jgi:hypothetical protein
LYCGVFAAYPSIRHLYRGAHNVVRSIKQRKFHRQHHGADGDQFQRRGSLQYSFPIASQHRVPGTQGDEGSDFHAQGALMTDIGSFSRLAPRRTSERQVAKATGYH